MNAGENDSPDYEDDYVESLQQIIEYCVVPTISQTFTFVSELLIFNLLFLVLTRKFAREEANYHVISTIVGLSYIYLKLYLYNVEAVYIIPLVYISYIIIFLFQKYSRQATNTGLSFGAVYVSILIGCEFYYHDHDAWLKVRGVVMVVMMKIMSLVFDIEKRALKTMPSIYAYSGYIWCPANSVLGPWITYNDYLSGHYFRSKVNMTWALSLIRYLIFAFIFVCLSNCINAYLITDNYNEYLVSYREASCFRMSHYFVSFVASSAMLSAGYTTTPSTWSYTITNPLEMELPRSLVNVVINWNIPTHVFLKKYVFANLIQHGQFTAVLATYLISSMLHGLNVEVSVVLLSLGIYSYIQYKLQDAIAFLLSACVRVRPCRKCSHTFKSSSRLTIFCNLIFSFTTVVYLAYVGCLMDTINTSSSAFDILSSIKIKFSKVQYMGHAVAFVSVLLTCLIRLVVL